MKNVFAILILCIGVATGFYLLHDSGHDQGSGPSTAPTAAPAAQPSALPAQAAVSAKPMIPAAATAVPFAKKPQNNVISFQVVDGLAIAFGDVVLGKPEAGFQGDHGSYDAPTPQLWDRPEIPYFINPELPNPKRVEKALDYFRQHTPIKFVPYDNQLDAIVFEPGAEHCYSALGRVGGLQSIKLAAGCQPQEIMHEMMHALGFVHEQSRPDRDQFIEVLWPNIDEKYQPQFAIVPDSFLEAEKGSSFDYHSIMLYQTSTFALRPDLPSMRTLTQEPIAPAQDGLSEGDLRRINHLYNLYDNH